MSSIFKLLLGGSLLCGAFTHVIDARAGDIHIIEARYIGADELADALRPFLREGGVISVHQQRVLIRADDENLAELKRLALELDRARTEFMLHLRQSLGDASATNRPSTRRYTSAPRQTSVMEQRVRLSDGQSAFISMGRERPSVTRLVGRHGHVDQLTRRRSESGFLISLRELSDAVELHIEPFYQREREQPTLHYDLAAAASSLQIAPGEWHEIGRIRHLDGTQAPRPDDKRYATAPRDTLEYKIEVFIEEIGPARHEALE